MRVRRRVDEALPDVVRHVVRAHRELRGNRGEQSPHERRDDDAEPADRHELDHCRIRHVVADVLRIDMRERRTDRVEVREDDERGERDDIPRPGADRVLHDLREERAAERMSVALRRQHALDDVAAAARLGAGVPDVPPLDRDRDGEDGDDRVRVGEVREEAELRHDGRVSQERVPTADGRLRKREGHDGDRTDHDDGEEVEVGVDRAANAADRRVEDARHRRDGKDDPRGHVEEDGSELDRAQENRRHDDEVVDDAEIDGAEAAQKRGRASRIAQLIERDVRRRAETMPELRVDEDREDAAREERPPGPVSGKPVLADELREEVRRVGRGHRRDHRDADEPPRHRTAGVEEVGRALRAPPIGPDGNREQDGKERGNDEVVDSVEAHAKSSSLNFHSGRVRNGVLNFRFRMPFPSR